MIGKQLFAVVVGSGLSVVSLFGQQRTVDYRYAPDYFHTPIGFVDDWQKTMVNEKGALLYDFGPGPYVRANTIIGLGLKGKELKVGSQRLEHARVPIVITELSGDGVNLTLETFALVPRQSQTAKRSGTKSNVHRRLGLNGALAWANPTGEVDPAFRNVAWGTNRPIVYEIGVKAGSRKRVVLGICESYRTTPMARMMEFHIEGAEVRTIDPIAFGSRNQPLVFFFDAEDVNRDGLLEVETRPSAGRDPNVILNGVWIFPEGSTVSSEAVISGSATGQAEVYIDCGREPQVQDLPTRIDALQMTSKNPSSTPVITIQSARRLNFNKQTGVMEFDGRPFVASRPKIVSVQKTERGWDLEFPKGTKKAEVIVIHGYRLPKKIAVVPDLKKERQRTSEWWKKGSNIPYGRIAIPDKQIQHLFDASVRTLYQNRDRVDGYPQFQPGSTVYRGLWIHDGVYYIEAAAILGDSMSARLATESIFQFQQPNGKVQVMWPTEMQRETPMLAWVMERYARLANNRDWLRAHWGKVVAAMEYTRQLRQQTMTDPASPYYGLMPPGFVDGGISGLTADYCSVYWALIGIGSGVDMARWLGETEKQKEWQALYDDLLRSFRTAAKRDSRRDRFGSSYLPVRVADTTTTDVPQRAQWAICEPIGLSPMFPPDDPLARGSLAVIDSTCIQGLPSTFGWMTGGIGVWFAPIYGVAHFAQGNVERAIDVLYAFANHATPHGAWAEEQMPKGVSNRTTGDYPTTSATACMLRSVLFFLSFERENSLELLRGLPTEWLAPGSVVKAQDLMTKFGRVRFEIAVSKDGNSGKIVLTMVSNGDVDDSMAQYTDSQNIVELYLTSFKKAEYRDKNGKELPDHIRALWGQRLELEFRK